MPDALSTPSTAQPSTRSGENAFRPLPATEVEAKRLDQPPAGEEIELSIVLPCLNEARTLKGCIDAAFDCFRDNNLKGEVVIADNGSTDGSQEIALAAGARLVHAPARGYGNALMAGIAAARGKYCVMGDSDMSCDYHEAIRFVPKLREGYDLVMGTRFGEGKILPGAMPWKNRYIGNPVLSGIGRFLFRCPVRDFHCGYRGFTKELYNSLNLRTTGMEFASEMVIKATLRGSKITQVPLTLHKDGRDRAPHLRPWRDGWRHLRFMLMLSPRWTLFAPGIALCLLGLILGALTIFGKTTIAGVSLDVHTLLAASLCLVVGHMWITAAAAMRIFSLTSEVGPPGPRLEKLFNHFTLERGLIVGGLLTLGGLATIGWLVGVWASKDFGELAVQNTLRPMITGATLTALGMQTVLMSVIYSMMGIRHKAASA